MLAKFAVLISSLRNSAKAAACALFVCLYASNAIAAIAESSATIAWADAFQSGTGYSVSAALVQYRAGTSLSAADRILFSDTAWPTAVTPHDISYISAGGEIEASVFANNSTLLVDTLSIGGDSAADALISGLFDFSAGGGLLDISIPYMLSSLADANGAISNVSVSAEFSFYDALLNETSRASVSDTASSAAVLLGVSNEVNGSLSLNFNVDPSAETYGLLNLYVSSESFTPETTPVPIPGGLFLFLPALIPFFRQNG